MWTSLTSERQMFQARRLPILGAGNNKKIKLA